jgi:hypothetical protein
MKIIQFKFYKLVLFLKNLKLSKSTLSYKNELLVKINNKIVKINRINHNIVKHVNVNLIWV